tara:strand:+ start:748 stop:1077 length:330 start_codon:yes stop_codon:yes gene_type:complete
MKKNKRLRIWLNRHANFVAMGISWLFTRNKVLQFELVRIKKINSLLNFSINWGHKVHHAGLVVEVGLLWFGCSLKVQDRRRWNRAGDCWKEELSPDPTTQFKSFKYEWF